MSSDKLRAAAKTLRQRAEAATPGPWDAVAGAFGDPASGPDHMRVTRKPHTDASSSVAQLGYEQQGGDDAAFIATMHPGVALALADWLDYAADHEPCWDCDDDPRAPHMRASLRVADLILGAE